MPLVIKSLSTNTGDVGGSGFDPWVWKIPGEGNGNTPVFLLGNAMDRGAWRAAGLGGRKQSDKAHLARGSQAGTMGRVENT